ncbi:TonB system transport protein ExbD [Acidisoma cellulosilytica]|uniref:Biopolymer transport protein ExbD n=1 Tax=Acidisoma cellulosilyticum TaxID=2802395 RepID=A0A963Z4W6_9PROT|nr:TonB system transport protein ExbD [Acidisoma cellulosilyticum]MCB8882874.1 TonB system transport protein ExbD [Acidisoma cellulosilyticum]
MAFHMNDDGDDLAEQHDINVTPFIDVMLVLLIIFMVAAPLATVDVPVELPTASLKAAPRPEKPLFLTIEANGDVAVNDTTVPAEKMIAALDHETQGDHTQRLFLRADKTVPYGMLMQTMDRLQHGGYLKIGLVAQQSDQADQPQ